MRQKDNKKISFETMTQWQLIKRRFAKHKLAVISGYLLIIFYILAVFSEFFAPYPSQWRDLSHRYSPPQAVKFSLSKWFYVYAVDRKVDPVTFKNYYIEDKEHIIPLSLIVEGEPYKLWGLIPMKTHFMGVDHDEYALRLGKNNIEKDPDNIPTFYLFGADKYGQDVFSRIIYGARISLSVGLIAIFVTFVLGLIIGGISGYVGGRVDNFIQRSIEVLNSFPQLPMWLALGAAIPADWPPLLMYFMITMVLSFLGWMGLARVVRGKILALREEDYSVAARLIGANHSRILLRHLLPGFTSHIIVTLTLSVPGMILGETSLSFLGLGLRPPIVSWGVLLQDCMNITVVGNYPWLLMPTIFIVLVVLCFNFLGDGLRDAADPYA